MEDIKSFDSSSARVMFGIKVMRDRSEPFRCNCLVGINNFFSIYINCIKWLVIETTNLVFWATLGAKSSTLFETAFITMSLAFVTFPEGYIGIWNAVHYWLKVSYDWTFNKQNHLLKTWDTRYLRNKIGMWNCQIRLGTLGSIFLL